MKNLEHIPIAFDRDAYNIDINESISIYQGSMCLQNDDRKIDLLDGEIVLTWHPKPRIEFRGSPADSFRPDDSSFQVFVDDTLLGSGMLYKYSIGANAYCKGILSESDNPEEVKGEIVNRVEFSIVNLPFHICDHGIRKDQSFWKGRYEFNLDNAKIIVDARQGLNKIIDELKSTGGCCITHHAYIEFNNSVTYSEAQRLLQTFRLCLRFLSGNDLGFVFINYKNSEKLLFKRSIYGVIKPYEDVHRVITMHSNLSQSKFVGRIHYLLKDKNNESAFSDLIHWYNQANANQGYAEGSLLLAQVGIELLYNWVIYENLDMIDSADVNRISATSKIKGLMGLVGMVISPEDVPEQLKNYCIQNSISVPESIVRLRNSLVHSNEKKRSALKKHDPIIAYQARNILLALIERYIFAIGHFKATYYNRLNNDLGEMFDQEIDL